MTLKNNHNLHITTLNVKTYRTLYHIQRADLLPSISADGTGTRQHLPADLSQTGEARTSGQYSATLGVNAWKLDFFGRIHSLSEQTLQQYLTTEQTQRSTQISLIANVANAYLQWQADQTLLQLTRDTLKTFEESYQLTQRSFDLQ